MMPAVSIVNRRYKCNYKMNKISDYKVSVEGWYPLATTPFGLEQEGGKTSSEVYICLSRRGSSSVAAEHDNRNRMASIRGTRLYSPLASGQILHRYRSVFVRPVSRIVCRKPDGLLSCRIRLHPVAPSLLLRQGWVGRAPALLAAQCPADLRSKTPTLYRLQHLH